MKGFQPLRLFFAGLYPARSCVLERWQGIAALKVIKDKESITKNSKNNLPEGIDGVGGSCTMGTKLNERRRKMLFTIGIIATIALMFVWVSAANIVVAVVTKGKASDETHAIAFGGWLLPGIVSLTLFANVSGL